jgi:hypothetical protein
LSKLVNSTKSLREAWSRTLEYKIFSIEPIKKRSIEVLANILSISKDLDDKRIWVSFSEESASRKPLS